MRKYKKLTHINRLQQKMDQKYGKGKFHAVFVLGLFFCLFFTSCANEPGSSRGGATTVGNTPPVGSAEGTTHTGQNAGARITVTNSGQTVTINNPFGEFPAVLDAYFARQDTESGEYKKIKSAAIGDTVYIVVDTVNLNARKITVTIKDKNNIISGDIPFQQYKQNGEEFSTTPEDVGGKFEAKVRNEIKDQRFALYKIALKGKDEDTTKEWKEDIQGHTGKKLQLSLVVNADEENVVYCGSNSSDKSQRSSDTENNVWLNQEGKWFEVNPTSCFCNREFTIEDLVSFNIPRNRAEEYLANLNTTIRDYQINTCIRKLHFLAQVRHESGEFVYREEIASGQDYEGRSDLGNTQPGDGRRFKGRGLIQITGRNNYGNYGTYKNENFTNEPNNLRLAQLPYCVDSAGWYWENYLNVNLNDCADEDDIIYITYRINGGFNGYLDDRKPKLVQMIGNTVCSNANYVNYDAYLIRNSRCWELHDAVYKYAVLNTNESRDCYIQYLALTEGYLNWSSIRGWERNNEKRDRKNRIETRRSRATTRSRATS